MVYSELFTAVKAYLGRDNLPQNDFNAMLASAEGEIQRALMEHPRNLSRGTFTQLANDAFLPLPVDLLGLVGLYLGGVPVPQFPAEMREEAKIAGGFIQKGACLELFPTPVEDTDYRLDYQAMVPPLVPAESASTNWVLMFHADVYLYGVLHEAAIYLRDDEKLQTWGGEFARRLDELERQGWGQGFGTIPTIRMA